jgi:hypothetical protein
MKEWSQSYYEKTSNDTEGITVCSSPVGRIRSAGATSHPSLCRSRPLSSTFPVSRFVRATLSDAMHSWLRDSMQATSLIPRVPVPKLRSRCTLHLSKGASHRRGISRHQQNAQPSVCTYDPCDRNSIHSRWRSAYIKREQDFWCGFRSPGTARPEHLALLDVPTIKSG